MEDSAADPYSGIILAISSVFKPLHPELIIGFVAILLLLFFSALVSGSEIAFFSLTPQQISEIKKSNAKRNQLILLLLEKPKRLLATILIANNFINIAIVILSTYLTIQIFDFSNNQYPSWLGFLVEVIIVSFLLLLFGEIIPKVYATQNSTGFARMMSSPLSMLNFVFHPVSKLLILSTSVLDKRINKKGHNISIDELSDALEITSDPDTPQEDQKILEGIVKFGGKDVKEIMRSRVDVVAVEFSTPFEQLMQVIVEHAFSRIPIYQENFDTISGVLYIKDLLPYINMENFNWQALIRPPFFVPESKMINDLLKEFQEKKNHLAIVVDEYGGTSGIVTLEDVIEEIVGEINDEFDSEEDTYQKLDNNNYIFEGKTLLNDFSKIIGVDDSIFEEAKGESDTLAGLILELKGEIPKANDSIVFSNFEFIVSAVDKRRIKKIKVRIHDQKSFLEENRN